MVYVELSANGRSEFWPETTSTRICCGEQDVFVVLDSDKMRIALKRGRNTREGRFTQLPGDIEFSDQPVRLVMLPNSSDVDASGSRFCAETSIIRM